MTDVTFSAKTMYARLGPYDAVIEREADGVLRLDDQGRWCSMRLGDAFYRSLIDTDVVVCNGRNNRVQAVDDAATIHDAARSLAREFGRLLRDDNCELQLAGSDGDRTRLLKYLDRAARWTDERRAGQKDLFRRTYMEPIAILPPDRYRDVVVQPALGCPNGRCVFCAFYQDRPFRVSTPEEFDLHLRHVGDLFGPALALRDGVFLGSANALAIPQKRLLDVIRQVRERLGIGKRGVGAFWDPDHCPRRSAEDWRDLKQHGMRIVLAGLETGSASLRKALGKSADVPRFAEQVQAARRGGIRLGITVLVGPGGQAGADEHRRATASVVQALKLTTDDIVYLSPLEGEDTLQAASLEQETVRLRRSLREKTDAKVVPYNMQGFRYYA